MYIEYVKSQFKAGTLQCLGLFKFVLLSDQLIERRTNF